jgi:hypothetical protein
MTTIIGANDNQVQCNLCENNVGLDTKLVDFCTEKTKVFFEALANISFYFSKVYFLDKAKWSNCEKQFGLVKTAMSVPSFLKGASSFHKNCKQGKLSFKKAYADLAFVVSDGVDSIKTLHNFKLIAVSDAFKGTIDKIKTLAGFIGLTKSIEDCCIDISKFKKMERAFDDVGHQQEKDKALEAKKLWVASELRAKEYDMLKNITGYALCVMSMTVGFQPWKFAIMGSIGLVGKFMNYYHKVDATYWQNKFVSVSV